MRLIIMVTAIPFQWICYKVLSIFLTVSKKKFGDLSGLQNEVKALCMPAKCVLQIGSLTNMVFNDERSNWGMSVKRDVDCSSDLNSSLLSGTCVNSQMSLFSGDNHVLLFFSRFCFLQVYIWNTKKIKLCFAFFPTFCVCLLRSFLLFDPTWSIFMKPSDSKTFFSPPEGQAIWKRDLWFRVWILWTLILQSYEMKTETIELSIGLSPHTEGVCPFWLQTETNYTECRIMYIYCPFS